MLRPSFLFFYLPKRLILYYYSCILSSFIFGITFTRYIPRKERNNVNLTMCCILFFFTVNISFNSRRIIHHGFLDYYFYCETKSLRFANLFFSFIKNTHRSVFFIPQSCFCSEGELFQIISRVNLPILYFAISNRGDAQSFTFN